MTVSRCANVAAVVLVAAGPVAAASAVNLDDEPRTISVTEGGVKTDYVIPAGQTAQFCPTGCFVTMPNGDVEVLLGFEIIEISGGTGRIR